MHNESTCSHDARHPLTDSRHPFLNPDQFLFQVTPPSLYTRYDVLWCEIFLWTVWMTSPKCASSQPPSFNRIAPQWQTIRQGRTKSPWLRRNMTAKPRISVCYQHYSHSKSKTQLCNSY